MDISLLEYLGICVIVFYIITGKYIYCFIKYDNPGFYNKLYRNDVSILMMFMLIAIILNEFL